MPALFDLDGAHSRRIRQSARLLTDLLRARGKLTTALDARNTELFRNGRTALHAELAVTAADLATTRDDRQAATVDVEHLGWRIQPGDWGSREWTPTTPTLYGHGCGGPR